MCHGNDESERLIFRISRVNSPGPDFVWSGRRRYTDARDLCSLKLSVCIITVELCKGTTVFSHIYLEYRCAAVVTQRALLLNKGSQIHHMN